MSTSKFHDPLRRLEYLRAATAGERDPHRAALVWKALNPRVVQLRKVSFPPSPSNWR